MPEEYQLEIRGSFPLLDEAKIDKKALAAELVEG